MEKDKRDDVQEQIIAICKKHGLDMNYTVSGEIIDTLLARELEKAAKWDKVEEQVDIICTFIANSAGAILIEVDGIEDWIPKSQITDASVDLYGKPVRVYGLPVYKVNEPHHFNVGWATQPKEKT